MPPPRGCHLGASFEYQIGRARPFEASSNRQSGRAGPDDDRMTMNGAQYDLFDTFMSDGSS